MTQPEHNYVYLGDGVYASFDGWCVILDTRAQHPVNRIVLEPGVWRLLKMYVESLDSAHEEKGTP